VTGPEHYREAERLLRVGDREAALIHATLACAAAQAITSPLGGRMRDEWLAVIWKEPK